MLTLCRVYEIEAAHRLTAGVPENHKCRRAHGHSYVLTVKLAGEPDASGMLIEFGDLDAILRPVIRAADHNDMNTLHERCSTPQAAAVAENPTAERIVQWFAFRMVNLVASARNGVRLKLTSLQLREDASSSVEWTP